MVLKRKRSDSELVTAFTSPARSDSSIESFDFPLSPSLAFPRAFATPSHISGRTMKRFRDNRPSEEEVHQRTLNILYSAQQQPEQIPVEASPSPAPEAPVAARRTQKSLHSFWNIKSSAPHISEASAPVVDQVALQPTSCEDCGAGLGPSDGSMEVGGGLEVEGSCGACGRHVCSHCSITNLDEQRRCLRCAGSRTWAPATTGSGWPASMRIF
ncbi:orf21 protein [Colletotrichum plurivorum]|uniref:Orf21 protein n=1 Tax=Colletotrichum plurivorum TaxID=2175906 RepID=A0A8H6KAQ1_9PEZI|nr:orf21 protein [Colletotrichum plurivorum]